jgi:ribosomal protein S18 acetylase RimI-like enzyme
METLVIQRITLSQIHELQKIGRATFSETFAADNSPENIKAYLDQKFAIDQLTTELNNANSEFYFALSEDKILGYLKVNFAQAQTELNDTEGLEIERIYVLQEFHGRNVGQFLYNKALQIANEAHLKYLWLGVWEENLRALSFYKKNGFIVFDKHTFVLGHEEQTDLLMKLTLK